MFLGKVNLQFTLVRENLNKVQLEIWEEPFNALLHDQEKVAMEIFDLSKNRLKSFYIQKD